MIIKRMIKILKGLKKTGDIPSRNPKIKPPAICDGDAADRKIFINLLRN
jgi:hypothetical protein